jgi:hypothetical protein
MSNGSWTLVYEADSNNAYSAKFLFHLLSGGLLAGTQYIIADMDGDKKNELAIKVGGELYIFKSIANNSYSLWYLRREDAMDAVTFYDFDHDGRQDIVISRFAVNSQGRGRLYADIYKASKLVSVEEERQLPLRIALQQCYPNPFNPSTTIEYSLGGRERVVLRVYNLLGQSIAILVNEEQIRGQYTVVWNAAGLASGIYLCRLEVAGISLSKKLLLIR